MLCPHCSQPIDPALVRAAANKDAGSRERPRAKGQAKRGCAHAFIGEKDSEPFCYACNRFMRWHATDKRWRIRYPKQKSPAE